jgi:hypothetical protein
MSSEPKTMQEIHNIRLSIYDKIKDMTPDEQVDYFNESTKVTVEKFGIKVGTPADNRRLNKVM